MAEVIVGATEIVGGIPPRQVDALTRVSGHTVIRTSTVPFCECGARQPKDWSDGAARWREVHLRDTWPLVPRQAGEDAEGHLARLSELYVSASISEQTVMISEAELSAAAQKVVAGAASLSPEAAGEVLHVLEHQMAQVRAEVLRTRFHR